VELVVVIVVVVVVVVEGLIAELESLNYSF